MFEMTAAALLCMICGLIALAYALGTEKRGDELASFRRENVHLAIENRELRAAIVAAETELFERGLREAQREFDQEERKLLDQAARVMMEMRDDE